MQLQQTQRPSFQKLGRSSTAQLKGQARHHVNDGMKKCGTRTNETEETHDTADLDAILQARLPCGADVEPALAVGLAVLLNELGLTEQRADEDEI